MFEDIIGEQLEKLDMKKICCPLCVSWDLEQDTDTIKMHKDCRTALIKCNNCGALFPATWSKGYDTVYVEHNNERIIHRIHGRAAIDDDTI